MGPGADLTPPPREGSPVGDTTVKCTRVQSDLVAHDTGDAYGTLKAFINDVNAQTPKKIAADVAGPLIADAQQIEAVITCTS